MTSCKISPTQNHLLASLPSRVQERIFPHLEQVSLCLGQGIYESGNLLTHVYFPVDSIISILYEMENGASTEISMVGHEGLVGIALFMGGETTTGRAIVRNAGTAFRLKKLYLKQEFERHEAFMTLMLRFTQSLITQMAQTAVCYRLHSIERQLCRWLLFTLDRVSGNEIIVTQELIATMLGVRREGVTEAAGKLQKKNIINYRRGHIRVLNRPLLEQLSCECYSVVAKETERLMRLEKRAQTIPFEISKHLAMVD